MADRAHRLGQSHQQRRSVRGARLRRLTSAVAQITSTRDNCLGQRCPEYARCHLVKARREAQEAQVVIVNHHLLLADLTLKEDGFGDVLGTADAVVIDEAHQLPDLAMQFFGASCAARGLANVLSAVRAEVSAPTRA